ncbi:hypothetical protein CC2G_009702 [Coprinopsis cinerea AmutBmut pab1-1]|nr:hypothetical protein CC2G_009702 [Coprinopsis cinerea AmutBmut pab1-1]
MGPLSSKSLVYSRCRISLASRWSLVRTVSSLASQLRTLELSLEPSDAQADTLPMDGYLEIQFPCLERVMFAGFVLSNTEKATEFWKAHPTLERVHVRHYGWKWENVATQHRFSKEAGAIEGLLPNLKYLEAQPFDLLNIPTIVRRLERLTVQSPRVPTILSQILTLDFPCLRSLSIIQSQFLVVDAENQTLEAAAALGFENRNPLERTFVYDLVKTLVYLAPNLEELAIRVHSLIAINCDIIAPDLAHLKNLERFFFYDAKWKLESNDYQEGFLESQVRKMADVCRSLTQVGSLCAPAYGGFPTAYISRNEDGSVSTIRMGRSRGLIIGDEDRAFPRRQSNLYVTRL